MKVLASTFGEGDHNKVLDAMRRLPYERLVLIGERGLADSSSFRRIRDFEGLSGHDVDVEAVETDDFMELVNEISAVLQKHARNPSTGERNALVLNISGGSKLLGDAALIAAFRLGIEACHCDHQMTKLPVIRGATALDRFTPAQIRFISLLGGDFIQLDDIVVQFGAPSKQAVERVMRDLRKLDLLKTEVRNGRVGVALSRAGEEVSRALGKNCSS